MTPEKNQDAPEPPGGHPYEQLVGLLEGDLALEDLRAVVRHCRACRQCQAELVEVAAGTAALRFAGRPELAVPQDLPEPAFLRQVQQDDPVPVPTHPEPSRHPARAPRPGRRRVAALVAGAAAAALAAVLAVVALHGGSGPAARFSLAPVHQAAAAGNVQMRSAGADKAMTVSAELAPAGPGRYYEVWLLQRQTGGMVALGVLPQNGQARYVIPAVLVARYDAVDISLQLDDGSTAHSADSVLRAYY